MGVIDLMAERKVVVYAGTSNVYPQMYTALKSLLINTPSVDQVYLLIEDDEFPYPLPEKVIAINVSEQEYFDKDSANYNMPWSYMAMMKCCLAHMFPNEKRMLWLDIDTIVDDDISDLFEIDLNGYFYAGAMEIAKSKDIFRYINVGVLMCNLEMLYQKEEELMAFLHAYQMNWAEQNIINMLCQGRIRIIESLYNASNYTVPVFRPKIVHFAAIQNYKNEWIYQKYAKADMPGLDGGTDSEGSV